MQLGHRGGELMDEAQRGFDVERKQVLLRDREHSRKPDEQFRIIESCSPGPFLEMFARGRRTGWAQWGSQAEYYSPTWPTYANQSQAPQKRAEGTKQQMLVLNDHVKDKERLFKRGLLRSGAS